MAVLRGHGGLVGAGGASAREVAAGFEPFDMVEAVLGFAATCSLRRAGDVSEAGQGRTRCC